MYHRIYNKILYKSFTNLNNRLNILHNTLGFGCPEQKVFISNDEIILDRKIIIKSFGSCPTMFIKNGIIQSFEKNKLRQKVLYKNKKSLCFQNTPPKVETINIRVFRFKIKIIKRDI